MAELRDINNKSFEIYDLYDKYVVNLGDPRTKGWFLIDSPVVPALIVCAYVFFVMVLGPRFMHKRPPFKLKPMIMCYDLLQVIFSLTFIFQCGILVPLNENKLCMEVHTDRERDQFMANLGWYYYMMKYLDLTDTIFFVLTKKWEHITFLHLYHHTSMICISWIGMKYIPSGAVAIVPYVNTWVHAFMYSYYFATLYYGKVDILIKKAMTEIQMGQFLITATFWFIQLINPFCGFSKLLLLVMIAHAVAFIYMFANFYYIAYMKPKGYKYKMSYKSY